MSEEHRRRADVRRAAPTVATEAVGTGTAAPPAAAPLVLAPVALAPAALVLLTLASAVLAAACTLEERTDNRPAVAAATAPADHHREVIQPADAPRLPVFSSAVRTGDLLFLSGNLGAVPGANPPRLVEGGVEAETRQTFANIEEVLDAAGLTFHDVVKCTVFLADIADYAAVNGVYVEYWGGDPPARSAIAGSGLALGARVEIECIAAFPPGR